MASSVIPSTTCSRRMPWRAPRIRQNHWFGSRLETYATPPHSIRSSHPPTMTNPTASWTVQTDVSQVSAASMAARAYRVGPGPADLGSAGAGLVHAFVAVRADPPRGVLVQPARQVQTLQGELQRGRRHPRALLLDPEPPEQPPQPRHVAALREELRSRREVGRLRALPFVEVRED